MSTNALIIDDLHSQAPLSSLLDASETGNVQMVQLLLNKEADPNLTNDVSVYSYC